MYKDFLNYFDGLLKWANFNKFAFVNHILLLTWSCNQFFTRRKTSRSSIHLGEDEDIVLTRLKQNDRKVKSDFLYQYSAIEIPKFVLIVEDFSTVGTEDNLGENNHPSSSEAEAEPDGNIYSRKDELEKKNDEKISDVVQEATKD